MKPCKLGHQWVDSIFRDRDGHWKLQLLCNDGGQWVSRAVPAETPHLEMMDETVFVPRIRTGCLPLNSINLAAMEELVDPIGLFSPWMPGMPASRNHSVYKLDVDGISVFVPAFLLIQALYMGDKMLHRALWTPNGIDILVNSTGPATEPQLRFRKNPEQNPSGHVVRTLAWLTSSRDARLSHANVLGAARDGRISLRPVEVYINGWIRGVDLDERGLLAFALGSVHLTYPVPYKDVVVHVGNKKHRHSAKGRPNPSPWSSKYMPRVSGEVTKTQIEIEKDSSPALYSSTRSF